MRKFFIIAVVMMMSVTARAQIQVIAQESPKEELCTIAKSALDLKDLIEIFREEDGIWLYMQTTNKFDDAFSFFLGENVSQAIVTLTDLRDLINKNTIGSRFVLKRSEDETCMVVVADALLNTQPKGTIKYISNKLIFGADGYAGAADLSVSNLKKLISRLSEIQKKEAGK